MNTLTHPINLLQIADDAPVISQQIEVLTILFE